MNSSSGAHSGRNIGSNTHRARKLPATRYPLPATTINPLPRILAMLLMPLFVTIVIACDSGNSNTGGSTPVPYANSPEGKPKYLPANPVPDPPEVLETKAAGQLPDFLSKASASQKERITASYAGSVEHYDQYKYIPCYCGCAAYKTAHKGLNECYIKAQGTDGSVTFTDHSLTCDKCQQAAEMTLAGIAAGKPLKQTRAEIFEALKYTDIWTDTPPVP